MKGQFWDQIWIARLRDLTIPEVKFNNALKRFNERQTHAMDENE